MKIAMLMGFSILRWQAGPELAAYYLAKHCSPEGMRCT
jgi:hypothetical protein